MPDEREPRLCNPRRNPIALKGWPKPKNTSKAKEVAAGYSSYGNQIGIAAGQIDEVYDEDYVAKRMEVGAVVGAAPSDHVIRKTPSS